MGGKGSGSVRKLEKTAVKRVPRITAQYSNIEFALSWLWQSLGKDEIDPRRADSMAGVAKALLSSLRQSDERSVQERVKKLAEMFAEIKQAGLAHVAKARLHQEEQDESEPQERH
jgi:hypothetical protein